MDNIVNKSTRFLDQALKGAYEVLPLAADASLRSYCRILHKNQSFILMDSSRDLASMYDFLRVGEALDGHYAVPKVLASDRINGFILLEDFGDFSYTKYLIEQSEDRYEKELYSHAVTLLADLHQKSSHLHNDKFAKYDEKILLNEALLFVDWYYPMVKKCEISGQLRKDYIAVWQKLFKQIQFLHECIVLRDYHADNLMWLAHNHSFHKVGLLDFQDALLGSYAYDMVSLLEDARRDVKQSVVEEMLELYIKQVPLDNASYMVDYKILGVQRNLKILGVFARKFVRDHNKGYLKFLPRVAGYIQAAINDPLLLPLQEWCKEAEINFDNYRGIDA